MKGEAVSYITLCRHLVVTKKKERKKREVCMVEGRESQGQGRGRGIYLAVGPGVKVGWSGHLPPGRVLKICSASQLCAV